ncbi:MAG TPA: N-6 DNA methylase [Gallicola sp.]|nr:N-6 DNA methylase [Gallicola sp.]
MKLEKQYYEITSQEKVKKLGQYFTPLSIAHFMSSWIMECSPKSILDPAVGNGVFLKDIDCENIECLGYEIDSDILNFFKENKRFNYKVLIQDYLQSEWDLKFDAIICNPPYNRFQMIDDRKQILDNFSQKLNFKISGYTNQYILFLLKSIYQLNDNGRLAYIIPNEFLNSGYGNKVKKYLIDNKLLYAIINFDSNINVFENALTTACIILIKKEIHKDVEFINITSEEEFNILSNNFFSSDIQRKRVNYNDLNYKEKWGQYFDHSEQLNYKNLVKFSKFAKAMRGIATGDNSYFVFNESKRREMNLNIRSFFPCITRAIDVTTPILSFETFQKLREKDKNIYVFDGTLYKDKNNEKYIKMGENRNVHKKYLTSHRSPWYSMEKKDPAPILINVFSRNRLKVIRNLANIKNLTCYHGIFILQNYDHLIDVLFCYLLTSVGQDILYLNRRQYGGGLDKFEPNDINNSMCLDFDLLTDEDICNIRKLYDKLVLSESSDLIINELESIFIKYLL